MKKRLKEEALSYVAAEMNEQEELNNDLFAHIQMSTMDILNTMNNTDSLSENYHIEHEQYNQISNINYVNTIPNYNTNNYSLLQQLNGDLVNDFQIIPQHHTTTEFPHHETVNTNNFSLFTNYHSPCKITEMSPTFNSNNLPQLMPITNNEIFKPTPIFLQYNTNNLNNNNPVLTNLEPFVNKPTNSINITTTKPKREPTINRNHKSKSTKSNISDSEKLFGCNQCSSRFSRKDELRRHEKIHSGIRTLTCPYCDKSFIRSDHRTTHIRTHTGEKPYKCEICSKCFARSDERTRHLKVHYKDSNYKSHKQNGNNTKNKQAESLKNKNIQNIQSHVEI